MSWTLVDGTAASDSTVALLFAGTIGIAIEWLFENPTGARARLTANGGERKTKDSQPRQGFADGKIPRQKGHHLGS